MYKYCTKKMVDKAVKQGREAVIKCASDKWWFFGTCTEKEFNRTDGRLYKNCSLCVAFDEDCLACPLGVKTSIRCDDIGSLYDDITDLIMDWEENPTTTNFKKFQAKARKLARVIGRLK